MAKFTVKESLAANLCAGFGSLFITISLGVILYNQLNQGDGFGIRQICLIILGLFFLLLGIYVFAHLNSFVVEVEGSEIKVKDSGKSYTVNVQDISKVYFSQRYASKGRVVLQCEIRSGDNKLKVTTDHVGFLNFLDYVKYNYDMGLFNASVMKSLNYEKLMSHMDNCPEGRRRKRRQRKEEQ